MVTEGAAHEQVFLATNSRPLAVGLTALLLSIPPIDKVVCLSDIAELLDDLANVHPTLIILDTALTDSDVHEMIREVRRLAPHSLMVILSENMAEFRELAGEGRHTVVVKGTDPAQLAGIIESLLETHVVA